MVSRGEVKAALERMSAVWPVLAGRDAMRQEIGDAIMGYAEALEPSDLKDGVSTLIRSSPTAAKDGGPAWPPGPNEVVGCILKARADRKGSGPRPPEPDRVGPREVVGRVCLRCASPVLYLPPERVLYCESCRSVQVMESGDGWQRRALNYSESSTLVFADER